MWDSLLELRMKMQKMASPVNQLPQFDHWLEFENHGADTFNQQAKIGRIILKYIFI